MGVEGEMPTPEDVQEIRREVARRVSELPPGDINSSDIAKLNSDDKYVAKFFRHVFDHPGEQTDAAAKMIINTFKWRQEQGASIIKEENFPQGLLDKGALFSHNRDKDGKKLLVFCVFKHIKGQEKMDDMKKFFIYSLERLGREEEGDQITLLFDCRGAGMKNMDMEFVQFIIGTLKDYYPDPLNYILVLEMPWVLNAAFKMIKAWLPPAAVKKIKFLTLSNMNEYVNDENRLEEWGGTDTWQYSWVPESATTEDSKDEVKKKVTFAMSNSASAESVASIGSGVSINNGINNNNSKDDILLLTPGQEILFSNSPVGDLVAKLQIQNVSAKPVGYKIKTTSPEKYRVRPSTGQLGPGATASVEIHCSGSQSTSNPGLVRDKFLITGIYLTSTDLTQAQLTEALKNNAADCQYRLRCQVQGLTAPGGTPIIPSDFLSPHAPNPGYNVNELDANRQMSNILKKVNQISVKQEELSSQLKLCLQILLILIALVILLLVVLLFYSNFSNPHERLVDDILDLDKGSNLADNDSITAQTESGKSEL